MRNIPLLLALIFFLYGEFTAATAVEDFLPPEIYIEAHDKRIEKSGMLLLFDGQTFSGYVAAVNAIDQIETLTPFVDGLKHGVAKGWYPDSAVAFERNYERGKREGIHQGWYPDGTLKFTYTYAGDVFHGAVQEWFEDGTLYRDFMYQEGKEEGRQKMWYEDGSIRANYVVKNGRRYGLMGSKPCS